MNQYLIMKKPVVSIHQLSKQSLELQKRSKKLQERSKFYRQIFKECIKRSQQH